MPLYSNDARKVTNSRMSYIQHWEDIPNGEYLVVRLFKPDLYPSATLCTVAFKVSLPEADWERLRQPLLDAYKAGKAISVMAHSGRWTVEVSDNFKVNYEPNEKGIHHYYDEREDCFILDKSIESTNSKVINKDAPF